MNASRVNPTLWYTSQDWQVAETSPPFIHFFPHLSGLQLVLPDMLKGKLYPAG